MGSILLIGAAFCTVGTGCVPALGLAGREPSPWTPQQSCRTKEGIFAAGEDRAVWFDPHTRTVHVLPGKRGHRPHHPGIHFNEIGSSVVLCGDHRVLLMLNLLTGERREWPVSYSPHVYYDPATDSLVSFDTNKVRVNGHKIRIPDRPPDPILEILDRLLSIPIVVLILPINLFELKSSWLSFRWF